MAREQLMVDGNTTIVDGAVSQQTRVAVLTEAARAAAASGDSARARQLLVQAATANQESTVVSTAVAQKSIDETAKVIETTTAAINADVEALGKTEDTVNAAIASSVQENPGVLPFKGAVTTGSGAYDAIIALLSSYGMSSVADKIAEIRALYPDISSADMMTLIKYDKRFNAPYMDRFAGNAQLMAKGFAPLDEKTYLANEQAYNKIFNAYGITQFANKDYYAKLIGGSVSPDEANSRVSMAFGRVLNDKMTLGAFNKFYPTIKTSDIAATLLDPEQQLPALQRQVTAAEIGGQALMQGLQTSLLESTAAQGEVGFTNVKRGTLGAEELAKMGVTKAGAAKAYGAIAEVLPTAEKLSSIYGSTLDQYGQLQAEQEQLQGMASAKRKREQLAATEIGTWSGQSGASRGAFSTNYLNRSSAAGLV